MSRLNYEEQFAFLISCIRHSSNGRVDFESVAGECEIVSKGAAAKRYERMMKAHSIHTGLKGTDDGGEEATTPRKRRKRAATEDSQADEEANPPSKKSKAKAKIEGAKANGNADDTADEEEAPVKTESAGDENAASDGDI